MHSNYTFPTLISQNQIIPKNPKTILLPLKVIQKPNKKLQETHNNEPKGRENEYPRNFDELSVLGEAEVGLRNRVEEPKDGSFGRPVPYIPDDEGGDEGGEQEEEDEEEGVADDNEDEDWDGEAQKKDGYENVENQRRNGLQGSATVVSQDAIREVVHYSSELWVGGYAVAKLPPLLNQWGRWRRLLGKCLKRNAVSTLRSHTTPFSCESCIM